METAIFLFKQYSGQGMMVTLFLVALLYLWFEEKNRENRRMFVSFPICILIVFFCPLVVLVIEKLSEEDTFWRMIWSLPMIMVISYAGVVLIRKLEGIKRYVSIVGLVLLIAISGDYLYDNPNVLKAENLNHIPDDIIAVCDEVIVEGREVRAAFPRECLIYVPQYTAMIHMPYGREMFFESKGVIMWNPLYEIMESEIVDAKLLAKELRNSMCHFVVLRKNTVFEGDLETEGFAKYCETDSYQVYLDKNNDPR